MTEARLLLVEDEPDILELLSTCLRHEGFEVVCAAEGAAALAAVRRHRPDLVVLDVLLPDMDGFEVVRRLRSGGDQTPVVFLTARDGVEDRLRGFTLGGDDYVTKPFHLAEVVARVRASEARKDVLSVPVQALVALQEGGYGVQLVEGSTVRTLPVRPSSACRR